MMLSRQRLRAALRAVAVALLLSTPTHAADWYVATDGNDANPGTQAQPLATFWEASLRVSPGDIVYIRGGVYNEKIPAIASGKLNQPITWTNYASETVTITNTLGACFDLIGRRYVIVDGLVCDGGAIGNAANVYTGAALAAAHHCEIRNTTIRNMRDVGIGIWNGGHHNRIENNVIENVGPEEGPGGEALRINKGAHHNLVANNMFSNAGHNLIFLWDATHNVVKRNVLSNAWWRAYATLGREAKYNLFDENQIFDTNAVNPDFPFPPAANLAAPENILRRTLIVDARWDGLEIHSNDGQGSFVNGNRIYNNVVYRSGSAALDVSDDAGSEAQTHDLVFVNNVFYRSGFAHSLASDIGSVQIDYTLTSADPLDGSVFHDNVIRDTGTNETTIKVDGLAQSNLLWYQTNRPQNFWDNLDVIPQFTSESARDFTLSAASPLVDAGSFLAHATSSGSGRWIPVTDPLFFHAGGEMVAGDWIQLEGTTQVAKVCEVDYTGWLGIDRQLSWSNGQGIALEYTGAGPDIGALEKDLAQRPLGTPCYMGGGGGCGLGFEAVPLLLPIAALRRRRGAARV